MHKRFLRMEDGKNITASRLEHENRRNKTEDLDNFSSHDSIDNTVTRQRESIEKE